MQNEKSKFASRISTDGGFSLDSTGGPIYQVPEFLTTVDVAHIHKGEGYEVVIPAFEEENAAHQLRSFEMIRQETYHPFDGFAELVDEGYLEYDFFTLSVYESKQNERGGHNLEYFSELFLGDEKDNVLRLLTTDCESRTEVLKWVRLMQPRCRLGPKSFEFLTEDSSLMNFEIDGGGLRVINSPASYMVTDGSINFGSRRETSYDGKDLLVFHYLRTQSIHPGLRQDLAEDGFGQLGTELVLEGEIEVDVKEFKAVSGNYFNIIDGTKSIYDEFGNVVNGEMRFRFLDR